MGEIVHGTAEDFKKCPRQPGKKRKQEDAGILELEETVNLFIHSFIQSTNTQ